MFFLVLIQLISFLSYYLELAVKIFFYGFIFLDLSFKGRFFLVDGYFFLLYTILSIVDLPVTLQNLFIIFRFKLNKFFFGFKNLFFFKRLCFQLSFRNYLLRLIFS